MAIVSCINSVLTCSRDCHVFSAFPRIMSHGVFLLLCDHFQNHPNRLFLCSHKRPLINSVLTCSPDCHVFSGFPRIISRGVFLLLCERISVSWAGRKERLYISKIAKFEGDFFKTNKDISPQSRVILQAFLSGGEQLTPHDTNVCTFLQLCGSIYFSSLIRHISLKLGNFTNSKGLFPVVSTDIPCLVHV